jgi:hypothetical protein
MTNVTGFLVRSNLSDTGTLPRTGGWTGCPDIIVAGTTAIDKNAIIASYGSVTDKPLTQGLTNYVYLRAKNMNTTPLTQYAYVFEVPGSLVLHPEVWYNQSNLLGYDAKNPDTSGGQPPIIHKPGPLTLTANGGQVVATDAFTWKPESTEHHCLVGVVANGWSDVMKGFPSGGYSMDGLAQWIYNNGSIGWHNVNIQAITSRVYESQIAYTNRGQDTSITFTIIAENVPVGAGVSFSSQNSTAEGRTIGVDWTTVAAQPGSTQPINPDFEVGTTLNVNAGYSTIITYRTDFRGTTPPANFKMHMKATVATAPPAPKNMLTASYLQADSFAKSYYRSHSPNAIFRDASGAVVGQGLSGYRNMLAAAASPFGGDDDDGGDLETDVVVVVGSHTTTPVSS